MKHNTWKRGFLTITAGQAASLIGSAAVQFSLIWWLASETASPVVMAVAGLCAFVPQMALGPFAGVWIDRLKRKTVIICADMFVGLVALAFSLFFIAGTPPYWSACLVLGVRAVGGVFHMPAIQAVVPMLVPPEELVRANGWSQFLQSGAFMLGPVIGAALYAVLPMWAILLADLLGAVIASVTVGIVTIPEPEHGLQQKPHLWREMKEGVQVFLNDKKLLILTLASTVGMVFYMPLSSFYPLMTSAHFRLGAFHASIVEFLFAGGMMLCSALVSRFGNFKNKFLVVHIGLVGISLTSMLCGLLPRDTAWFWVFAGLCLLMGASANLYNIPYIAYMQETIAPEAMGRAFSLMGSLMSATMPLGLLIAGPIAQASGVARWFVIAGVAFIAVTIVSALLVLPERRTNNNQA